MKNGLGAYKFFTLFSVRLPLLLSRYRGGCPPVTLACHRPGRRRRSDPLRRATGRDGEAQVCHARPHVRAEQPFHGLPERSHAAVAGIAAAASARSQARGDRVAGRRPTLGPVSTLTCVAGPVRYGTLINRRPDEAGRDCEGMWYGAGRLPPREERGGLPDVREAYRSQSRCHTHVVQTRRSGREELVAGTEHATALAPPH